ncbi:MAG TPA: ATP-binding cassette domain-containing protein, partial [Mobilitalea sp.]|nr:ATP-binding cassette domain-containing protein [Mobilitalea sp.]
KYVKTLNISDLEVKDLVPLMIGREVKNKYLGEKRTISDDEQPLFEVRNITRKDGTCRNISFEVYKGEILGFAGLIGAGRTECMEGIFGAKPISSGEIYYKGKRLKIKNTFDAMKQGLAMVTENRRETGFFYNFPIWKEIAVSTSLKLSKMGGFTGLIHNKQERIVASDYAKKLNVKCTGIDQMTYNLSGGNQQKVIISKWLAVNSNVFIFDEPTKGIDVGAKSEIYTIMRNMANEGKAIIMVSSEMPELLSTCDRIIVFRDGEISGVLNNDEATEEKIMMLAVNID